MLKRYRGVAGRVRDFTEETSTSYWSGAATAPLGPHSLADAAAKAAPAVVNVTLQGGSQGLFNVRQCCMHPFITMGCPH